MVRYALIAINILLFQAIRKHAFHLLHVLTVRSLMVKLAYAQSPVMILALHVLHVPLVAFNALILILANHALPITT